MTKKGSVTRRTFLERSAGTAAVTLVARHALGGTRRVPPSDRINVAYVGCGTQGLRQLIPALQNKDLRITSVCDPNRHSEDYGPARAGARSAASWSTGTTAHLPAATATRTRTSASCSRRRRTSTRSTS